MSHYSSTAETDFNFRTKDGIKRPTVTIVHEVPSAEELASLLVSGDKKVVDLLASAANAIIIGHIRGYVDADADFDQAKYDALAADGKFTIEAIAKDYLAVMPGVTGKSVEKVTAAASLFVERYRRVAGDNAVLAVLQDQLSTFVDAAGEEILAKHERAITFLVNKVEELLSVKVTADAL